MAEEDKKTLSDFFSMLSEEKSKKKTSLSDFFAEAAAEAVPTTAKKSSPVTQKYLEPITEEVYDERVYDPVPKTPDMGTLGGSSSQVTTDPLTPLNQNFVTYEDLQNHYKSFIVKVQTQLSTLGGGGETKLRRLDDVERTTIADGKYLKYDAASKKFVFDELTVVDVQHETRLVTSATYSISNNDYYVGVNRNGAVQLTLPTSVNSGKTLVIKDESGNASQNPISVVGDVDNSTGFTLQLDNGSITLIYRDGWRII